MSEPSTKLSLLRSSGHPPHVPKRAIKSPKSPPSMLPSPLKSALEQSVSGIVLNMPRYTSGESPFWENFPKFLK